MRKEKSRRSWKKELDHKIGEELKEKGWKSMEKESCRKGMKKLDCEEVDELKKYEGA